MRPPLPEDYLGVDLRPFQKPDAPNLYPEELQKEINIFNGWLYPHINNAHYRMAFWHCFVAYEDTFSSFSTRFVDQIDFEGAWSAPQNRKALSKTPEEKFLRN